MANAFVASAVGAHDSDGDIIALMRDHDMASYKLPERLELIGALPRNPVDKITKPELRPAVANHLSPASGRS